jgi:hypothetical protein
VRASWGLWLGKHPKEIPVTHLRYLALDVLTTFGCFRSISPAVVATLDGARDAFGYVDAAWLDGMIARYGPQTHHLQVMAAVALDGIERAGFGLDLANREEIIVQVRQLLGDLRENLRPYG